jgi:hypothetical protein
MYVCMYVCMYVHMYVYMGPPFQDLGSVGRSVGAKDSLYKVSYKSKYGSKALDQESSGDEINSKVILGGWTGGGWGYLAPSPYIKGQMEAFYDRQNTTSLL